MIYHSNKEIKLKNCVNNFSNDTFFFPTFPTESKILILNKLNIKIVLEKLWICWNTLEIVFIFQRFPTQKQPIKYLTYCKSVL